MLGGDSGCLMGIPVKTTPPELTFLTSVEAADLLRVSRRTLERMRIEGTGPRYLKVGPGKRSRVIYRQSDIMTWLDRQSFASTSEYTT